MNHRSTKRESGFSLLEMVVSLALGSIVLGAAVQIYIQGVQATWTTTQREEMQQDFRAASNLLTKDLSLAGAGLNPGTAIALPSAVTPVYGCDQTGTCYINGGSVQYPKQGTTPYLYGLLPGYNAGPILLASQGPTDIVTVAYTDSNFFLNCYTATISAVGVVTFAPPSGFTTWAATGCLPTGTALTAPQAVNDAAVGLTAGDLVYFPSLNGTPIVAEVTGAPTLVSANTYTVPFANSDVLHMNQTSGGKGLNGVAVTGTGTSPVRLLVISYYINNTVAPPRLMRQVDGHTPIPAAENVVYMKLTYDLFNDATNTPAVGCENPGASGDVCVSGSSSGLIPNQITKINVQNMAMDSSLYGSQFGQGNGYQRLDLQTSVCARNLTYANNFPN
jgi:prepilin-type N-terminal cleavage/methylation domain-containing protein